VRESPSLEEAGELRVLESERVVPHEVPRHKLGPRPTLHGCIDDEGVVFGVIMNEVNFSKSLNTIQNIPRPKSHVLPANDQDSVPSMSKVLYGLCEV
jgi:hypothetical protein